ncbi:hypothetical protein DFQ29_001484 [Apophysomyces sp. BC1021]|nr:hypothetical protein DFQ29_001484 [Apophysomyces sp. BC1021]
MSSTMLFITPSSISSIIFSTVPIRVVVDVSNGIMRQNGVSSSWCEMEGSDSLDICELHGVV